MEAIILTVADELRELAALHRGRGAISPSEYNARTLDKAAARVAALEANEARLVRLAAGHLAMVWQLMSGNADEPDMLRAGWEWGKNHPWAVAKIRAWLAQPGDEKGGEG